jgi:hypothetical protein
MSGIRERHILRSQPKLNNIRSYGPRQPRAVIIFTVEDASRHHAAARKFSYSAFAETAIGALRSQARAKAQRYFASDLDPLSSRLFDASGIEAVEVVLGVHMVACSNAGTARAPIQQSNKSVKASYKKPELI